MVLKVHTLGLLSHLYIVSFVFGHHVFFLFCLLCSDLSLLTSFTFIVLPFFTVTVPIVFIAYAKLLLCILTFSLLLFNTDLWSWNGWKWAQVIRSLFTRTNTFSLKLLDYLMKMCTVSHLFVNLLVILTASFHSNSISLGMLKITECI